ncbi:hypothetical protein EVAR_21032_1 [Eumeta japonica]|uniref:Uncharacterized protein n=1 Tax=Eumeta variegata TaxID=151549 RepID=A0A4C1V0J1_EUMVA|nr:hypothetical protein EVAR_21032_1 [Eumeta japonica]
MTFLSERSSKKLRTAITSLCEGVRGFIHLGTPHTSEISNSTSRSVPLEPSHILRPSARYLNSHPAARQRGLLHAHLFTLRSSG